MADQNLIRNQVQAQLPAGSGVDFNMGALATTAKAVNQITGQAIQAASGSEKRKRQSAGIIEKRKRDQNELATEADMVELTSFVTGISTSYGLALAAETDPQKIDKINNDYQKEVEKFINNPRNMRNKRSLLKANKLYKLNSQRIFKGPAELRKASLLKQGNIAKFQSGIAFVKDNPLQTDKEFKAKLEYNYDKLVEMGVYQQGEIKLRIDRDMKQKEVDMTKTVTAQFQTQVNEHARYAENLIGFLKTDKALQADSKKQAAAISEVLSEYDVKVKNEIDGYRTGIEETKLDDKEKRFFLKQIDTNLSYQKSYLSKLSSQINAEQKNAESDSIVKFQAEWALKRPNQMAPLSVLKAAGLPNDFIEAYQKGFIAKKSTQQDFVKDTVKMGSIADRVMNLTPESDPVLFNQLVRDAASIDNSTLRNQALAMIEDRRKPDRFNDPVNKEINLAMKQLPKDLFTKGIDIPSKTTGVSFTSNPEFSQGQVWQSLENIKREARAIYQKQGLEASSIFINNEVGKINDKDTKGKTLESYLQRTYKTDRFRKPPRQIKGQGFPAFQENTILIDGVKYLVDPNTKTLQQIK